MTTIQAHSRRRLSELTGLRPSIVGKSLKVTRRATQSSPQSIMRMLKRGIPLVQFNAKRTRVSTGRGRRNGVSIVLGGNREIVPGGFLAEMKSGHKGIYKRRGKKRLPVDEMFSNELQKVSGSREFIDEVKALAIDRFREVFRRELEFQLNRKSRGG